MASGIFAKISQERIYDILEVLHGYISIPIQLIDDQGQLAMAFGESPKYCDLLIKNIFPGKTCFAQRLEVGQQAKLQGGPYIFTCHANLTHIAFPLIDQKELLGYIIIGPFLMDAPDSTLISGLAEKYNMSPLLSLELYDELSGLKVIVPSRVRQLSQLVGHLLLPLLPAEQALMKQMQEKLYQQSKISEAIQMFKEQPRNPTRSFLYQKESELLANVRTGNLKQSKALLNELIGFVLFSEGGKIETVRLHAIELSTLLSRVAIDGGASVDSVYTLNEQFIRFMIHEQNLDELCALLQNMVVSFIESTFNNKDQGNLHIRKALQYIASNYGSHISLTDVAEVAELSPSYFSAMFSKVIGMSFRDYLCYVRVEESKRLLQSTNYSMAEIATAVGFPDQSYYCKAFKRLVGVSPGKFRK